MSGLPHTPAGAAPRANAVSRQFFAFVALSGVAALANVGSRILFDYALPYPAAIACAFCVGMTVAFVLNRLLVFRSPTRPVQQQVFWFIVINLASLAQTMLVSLLLARWLFPLLGFTWHAETIAHCIGVGVPAVTSFLGHRHFSFR